MRLVPEMTPEKTFAQYKKYVEKIGRRGRAEVRLIHSGEPIVVGTDNPYVKAATKAMKRCSGRIRCFPGGRVDSDCGGFCEASGDSDGDDGVRAARR